MHAEWGWPPPLPRPPPHPFSGALRTLPHWNIGAGRGVSDRTHPTSFLLHQGRQSAGQYGWRFPPLHLGLAAACNAAYHVFCYIPPHPNRSLLTPENLLHISRRASRPQHTFENPFRGWAFAEAFTRQFPVLIRWWQVLRFPTSSHSSSLPRMAGRLRPSPVPPHLPSAFERAEAALKRHLWGVQPP